MKVLPFRRKVIPFPDRLDGDIARVMQADLRSRGIITKLAPLVPPGGAEPGAEWHRKRRPRRSVDLPADCEWPA